MKKLSAFLLAILLAGSFSGRTAAQTTENYLDHKPDTRWFEDARFGMFVHFGPYAVLGGGEWVMNSRKMKASDYTKLQDFFDPEQFDAAEWVRIAKEAGMKYITFTSRHHDGFSNWDTKQSDWNIMNTPYGKDLVKQLTDECHKQGMKIGFYYSTLDWTRGDYKWDTGRTGQDSGRDPKDINWRSYIDFMKAQLTELLTNYGPIACIWLDGQWDQNVNRESADTATLVDWHYPELYSVIRKLQPECLIANNHHTKINPGEDIQVFERDVPGENHGGYSADQEIMRMPLETCQTINGSWGYRISDNNFKSVPELLHLLIRTAGMGANLLLNVGPQPNGKIEAPAVERLAQMGEWLEKYGHTIYATQAGIVSPQEWGSTTRNGKTHYLHVTNAETRTIELPFADIKSARWLNVQGELSWKKDRKTGIVTFTLGEGLDPVDSIIEVTLK